MKPPLNFLLARAIMSSLGVLLILCACGHNPDADLKLASSPADAASQLEKAFERAETKLKASAAAASEAMRKGEYEKAILSLQTIRSGPPVSFDQGLAIHSSTVAMEAKLVRAVEAGDKNAQRAYELLKALKRS